jgi:hypothetical protein
MRNLDYGQRPVMLSMARAGLLTLALLATGMLAACTTAEGTNALTDPGTFEREVMTSTLQGLSLVPQDQKAEPTTPRAPLVLPKANSALPAPGQATAVAALPKDSSTAQIDTSKVSAADMARLRNARVVDLTSVSGRPLTETEAKKLTARMKAAQVATGPRPLYLPPAEYYTTVGGQDLVCKTPAGDLVPLTDKACPAKVRNALTKR